MDINKLKSMPTNELIELYNDLTDQQVKRMKTRADAERRTIEALKAKGKWVDEVIEGEPTAKGQRNINETAEAGINDGAKQRLVKKPERKGRGKGKGKRAESVQEAEAKAKPGKGAGKAGKATGKAAGKPAKEGGSRRGAPTKNQTFIALAPGQKGFNPKGMRLNASSARAKVLEYIQSNEGKRTRDQTLEHFKGEQVAVDASLYFLTKHGFIRVAE